MTRYTSTAPATPSDLLYEEIIVHASYDADGRIKFKDLPSHVAVVVEGNPPALEPVNVELLDAAKAALAKICGDGWDGSLGHHPDNPLPTQLRRAIAKAEGR